MRRAGEVLKKERLLRELSLEAVEGGTKIKKETLEAIEDSDFLRLPAKPFAEGFVRTYAKFLNLDERKVLAFFRREKREERKQEVFPTFVSPQGKLASSRVLTWSAVLLGLLVLLGYLLFQSQTLLSSPKLIITSPSNQEKTNVPLIVVSGQTEEGVILSVNDQEIAVDPKGLFSEEVRLKEGSNEIEIVAQGKFGRRTTLRRQVIFLP